MKRVENNYKSQLGEEPLSSLDGNPYAKYNPTKAIEVLLQRKNWEKTWT